MREWGRRGGGGACGEKGNVVGVDEGGLGEERWRRRVEGEEGGGRREGEGGREGGGGGREGVVSSHQSYQSLCSLPSCWQGYVQTAIARPCVPRSRSRLSDAVEAETASDSSGAHKYTHAYKSGCS